MQEKTFPEFLSSKTKKIKRKTAIYKSVEILWYTAVRKYQEDAPFG